jgi:hypothetical protein
MRLNPASKAPTKTEKSHAKPQNNEQKLYILFGSCRDRLVRPHETEPNSAPGKEIGAANVQHFVFEQSLFRTNAQSFSFLCAFAALREIFCAFRFGFCAEP